MTSGRSYRLRDRRPGVFAIGDVRAGSTKRVAAAVGEGAAVVAEIHSQVPRGRWRASQRPRWEVSIDLLRPSSLDPSVRQLDGSCAHFLVQRGRVVWCPDSGIVTRE